MPDITSSDIKINHDNFEGRLIISKIDDNPTIFETPDIDALTEVRNFYRGLDARIEKVSYEKEAYAVTIRANIERLHILFNPKSIRINKVDNLIFPEVKINMRGYLI